MITKYNGFWCDKIRPVRTKTETIEGCSGVKNTNTIANQNGNLQTSLHANTKSSFYAPNGFPHSPFHQIQQNEITSSHNSIDGGFRLDQNIPQNYKLSTRGHHLKVLVSYELPIFLTQRI